jgi:hypothetical protein
VSPLRLFGVLPAEGHHGVEGEPGEAGGAGILAFRDLAALVREVPSLRAEDGPAELEEHQRTVQSAFAHSAVLPAPPGVVFRSRDVLLRWLELHYVTLNDALGFLDGRVGARVYVTRSLGDADEMLETTEAASDVAAIAAGSFRVLRRHAVVSVPLRSEGDGAAAGSAFLVERERWDAFVEVVKEEDRRLADLSYEVTGPWPPYDFVRMQFGG